MGLKIPRASARASSSLAARTNLTFEITSFKGQKSVMTSNDQERLGFREPPIEITRSCLYYMGRIMEVREFMGFYFSFVKTSCELAPMVDKKSSEGGISKKALKVIKYDYSNHRQLVNELMLSRAVETFDLYVLNILREIFTSKPEILKSDKKVDASTLIELRTPEEIIFYLAENQISELGYKPLTELRKWIADRTGLDLFISEDIFDIVLFATEVRNLIAHNDCMTNDVIMQRLGEMYSELEISDTGKVIISDEWLRKCCYALDGVVFDFDERVCAKFEVYRANRLSTFFIR